MASAIDLAGADWTVGPDDVLIAPARTWSAPDLKSLWQHRELLLVLVWRDVKARYKQTILGVLWAVLQPTLTMVVFTIFFGRLARVDSDGVAYPIFFFAALLPWIFFANGVTQATNSLTSHAGLITKVYFPRLLIPTAGIGSGLIDFSLSLGVLAVLMIGYAGMPTAAVWLLPIPVVLLLVTTLGAGYWLSALNMQFRDVRFTIPFMMQLWMFISPIAYPASLVQGKWRILYGLNPMTGVIEMFRWSLCAPKTPLPAAMVAVSSLVSVFLLVTGALYFRRMERGFADLV